MLYIFEISLLFNDTTECFWDPQLCKPSLTDDFFGLCICELTIGLLTPLRVANMMSGSLLVYVAG